MRESLNRLQAAVTSWPGVSASPHRFGGLEFTLGHVEVGHVHFNGMVDIPFNSKIRNQLIAEGRAEVHHFLKDTGWISFYIRSDEDVEKAIWLFKLSYLFNATRGQQRAALEDKLNIADEVAHLNLSEALGAIFSGLTRRGQTRSA
jgi:hypothetical protein